MTAARPQVMFICTHNSARSQMAEGIMRHLAGPSIDVYSSGTVVTGVNAFAIQVMKEKGIDISGQHSKSLKDFSDRKFDHVITVCDRAKAVCPVFPGGSERLHWGLADPGEVPGTDNDRLRAFRETRDILFGLIDRFLNERGIPCRKR